MYDGRREEREWGSEKRVRTCRRRISRSVHAHIPAKIIEMATGGKVYHRVRLSLSLTSQQNQ